MRFVWDVLQHPIYSSDLTPTDYLLRALNNSFSLKIFHDIDDEKNATQDFINSKFQYFYLHVLHLLPDRWKEATDSDG